METFLQQLINGLSLGAIYALIALGYTMVYGVLRLINFAHGDVYMLGAFAGYYLANALNLDANPSLLGAIVVTFGAMAVTIACLTFFYGLTSVLLTHFLAARMRANPRIGRVLEKVAGVFLVGFGVKLALSN